MIWIYGMCFGFVLDDLVMIPLTCHSCWTSVAAAFFAVQKVDAVPNQADAPIVGRPGGGWEQDDFGY